jgi:hypothetical protein
MLTLEDIKDKLKQLDEVTLLEILEITSEDLVDRFTDLIEKQQDTLELELDDNLSWDSN